MEVDQHIGCAMSGLIADARTLVEHARVETQVQFLFLLLFQVLVDYIVIHTYHVIVNRIIGSPMVSQ